MTYRQPAFMLDNALAAATNVATEVLPFNSYNAINAVRRKIIDGRQGGVASWVAALANAGWRIDTQSTPTTELNRFVMPEGHTGFISETLRIYHSQFSDFSPATQVANLTATTNAIVDLTLSSGTQRYWAFQVSTASLDEVFSCGGFWVGVYQQLTTAAAVQPQFSNGWVDQVLETEFPSGIASIELASPRRTFSLEVRDVDPASSDYALLDQVMQARGRSFWYWPPDTTDAGPYLVRLSKRSERRQEFAAPSIGLRYRMSFEFVEDKL